jgi:hypothetical protein
MNRDYYNTPKSNFFMRVLWYAAGGDRYILERATYADQVKYMTLGGVIFATSFMAAMSGGYAFYTIFSPRSFGVDDTTIFTDVVYYSIVFGLFWGIMIFNLDRFIVSSTGKGDGTEEITWKEFKGAIPRIIMGTIIAITISKPVEIRMFKTEIDVKLYENQLIAQKKYQDLTNKIYDERIRKVDVEINKIIIEKDKIQERINSLISEKNKVNPPIITQSGYRKIESGDYVPFSYSNPNPLINSLEIEITRSKEELNKIEDLNSGRMTSLKLQRDSLLVRKDAIYIGSEVQAKKLDGLLERIKLADEVAGIWISLFITLLFMAIELTPIFFKLMLVKSPYDYLKDNIDELIKAENGIYTLYDYHKDRKGVERDYTVHYNVEKIISEKKEAAKAQDILAKYAVEKFIEQKKREIDKNPESFIHPNT